MWLVTPFIEKPGHPRCVTGGRADASDDGRGPEIPFLGEAAPLAAWQLCRRIRYIYSATVALQCISTDGGLDKRLAINVSIPISRAAVN